MKETYEVFHTSYLNEGQCKTDKDVMVLGHMAIIPFPVLCKCRKVLKRTKTTKINCKDDETGAELCQNQNSLVIAGGDVWRRRETSGDVARLLLMVPLEPWQNSTPFFGAAALCATKIDNFRTYLTTWSTHSSKRRSLRWTSFKRQIMEVIEVDRQLFREYNY